MRSDQLDLVVMDILPLGSRLQLEWDQLTAASHTSGFMQSTAWAAFKRRQGFRTVHLLLIEREHLVGGAVGYASAEAARNGWLRRAA